MVREELEEMKRRKGSLARGVSYKSPWGWGWGDSGLLDTVKRLIWLDKKFLLGIMYQRLTPKTK